MTSQNEDSGTTKTSVVASIPKKEEESDWDNLYDDSGESILSKLSKVNKIIYPGPFNINVLELN